MVATATIKVNNKANGGKLNNGGNDKEVVDELKKLNKAQQQNNNSLSALAGLGKIGAVLGALGITGAGNMLIAGAGNTIFNQDPSGKTPIDGIQSLLNRNKFGSDYSYEEVSIEGVGDKVAKVDEKTGKIVELLSREEAERLGILDKTGDIKEGLTVQNETFKTQTAGLKDINNSIMLSTDEVKSILQLERVEKEVQQQINEQKLKKLQGMGYNGTFGNVVDASSANLMNSGTPNTYDSNLGIGFDNNSQGYSAWQQITSKEQNTSSSNPSNNTSSSQQIFINLPNQWSSTGYKG